MAEQIKILIFEDNPTDAELVQRTLRKGGLDFTAEVAPDKGKFLGLLDKFVPDIILADYSVPGYNGLAAMEEARKRFPTVPAVIVSGTIGEEFAIECLKAGATDYVLKDKLTRLVSVIGRALNEAEQLLEKKQAEEALQKTLAEKQFLASVVERSSQAFGVGYPDGRLGLFNPAFETLTGYSKAELRSLDWNQTLTPPEWHEIETEKLAELNRTGKPVRYQKEYLRKDGTRVPIELLVHLSRDDAGRPQYYFSFITDINERKRAEAAMVQLTEELKRSNKELEEFAKVASHDLREPLRAVAGFVQLIKERYDDKLDDKGRSYIQFAVDGAKRMDELLSGLLECSKAQITDEPLSKFPAQEALNAAITILHKKIIETGAVITFDELPIVNAHGRQLTRLFANLIDNAIKFRTEPGEHSDKRPQIHVGCQKMDAHWQFSVRDNGIGIEQQFQERIFNIFQRLHNRQQHPGCGVGLTICRKIVERHGGRIWVESQAGKGSTFHFTI